MITKERKNELKALLNTLSDKEQQFLFVLLLKMAMDTYVTEFTE